MEYSVSIKKFDSKKHSRSIRKIKAALNGIDKEKFFMNIARDILSKQGFKHVTKGPSTSEIKGVPFDFIATKKGNLSLIELKGSMNTFNYSSEVQFARLYQVVSELKKRQIVNSIFLLQINLNYSLYQILDSNFYDIIFININKSLGLKTPILPIVDDLIKKMRKKDIKL